MIYRFAADIVLIFHVCFILFAALGGFLIFYRRWIWKLHLPAVLWGFAVQYFVWICPLTDLENFFRQKSGAAGYPDGFVNFYLTALIYHDLPVQIHWILGIALILVNFFVYLYVFGKIRVSNV